MEPFSQKEKPCFSPDALALAQHAFEQTWLRIAPRFAVGRHAEVRDVLAVAVMGAVRVDSNDVAPLCKAGLQVVERMYPVEMHMRMGTLAEDATANDSGREDV
jgi:hypothetical protein